MYACNWAIILYASRVLPQTYTAYEFIVIKKVAQ